MTHDVFLSYSSKDAAAVQAVCKMLEQAGVKCWMAPRNISAGQEWGPSIIDAITQAKAMVLVFSASTNISIYVPKEVERAVTARVPIIPLRIQNVAPAKNFELLISSSHFLDAFPPPLENHLHHLTAAVQTLLNRPIDPAGKIPDHAAKKPRIGWALTIVLIIAFGSALGVANLHKLQTLLGLPHRSPASTSYDPDSDPPTLAQADQAFAQKSYAIALAGYTAAVQSENPHAQYQLGQIYQSGLGVTADPPQALNWYRKSADHGDADAQLALGAIYQEGQILPRDNQQAAYWYGLAAAQNNKSAQLRLAFLLQQGEDIPRDLNRAIGLYQAAANQGSAQAANQLAYLYQSGQIGRPDQTQALTWYIKAALNGSAAAQFRVGHFYAEGIGMPGPDLQTARSYMTMAASNGNTDARAWLAAH